MGRSNRRSQQVMAPILAASAAALLTGCHTTDPQRCVDEQGRIVDAKFCQGLQPGQTAVGDLNNNGGHYDNGIFYPHIYRYYYGGSGGGFGSFVSGGGYMPTPGHSYSVGSGTSRGGFGSSFSGGEGGHGGGGGE
ncbi:hypothetical protein SAMN05421819_2363 [Bryocella elongata]|uniref:Lipoprotein n=1 Tax=Bryocella elongata TaxID=863522 RepID=A0A1H5YKB7_9BACT|nr:hypothetical protein [Bryocella elongata]SEG24551.1 hypothetical protein SAMN05421819_2363 [Bryocella elongata]